MSQTSSYRQTYEDGAIGYTGDAEIWASPRHHTISNASDTVSDK